MVNPPDNAYVSNQFGGRYANPDFNRNSSCANHSAPGNPLFDSRMSDFRHNQQEKYLPEISISVTQPPSSLFPGDYDVKYFKTDPALESHGSCKMEKLPPSDKTRLGVSTPIDFSKSHSYLPKYARNHNSSPGQYIQLDSNAVSPNISFYSPTNSNLQSPISGNGKQSYPGAQYLHLSPTPGISATTANSLHSPKQESTPSLNDQFVHHLPVKLAAGKQQQQQHNYPLSPSKPKWFGKSSLGYGEELSKTPKQNVVEGASHFDPTNLFDQGEVFQIHEEKPINTKAGYYCPEVQMRHLGNEANNLRSQTEFGFNDPMTSKQAATLLCIETSPDQREFGNWYAPKRPRLTTVEECFY